MKEKMRYLKVILMICLYASVSYAQESDEAAFAAIAVQNAKYEQGYNTGNSMVIVALHTGNARILPPNRMPFVGRSAVEEMIKGDLMMGEYTFDLMTKNIERHGDVVIEQGYYNVEIKMADGTVIIDEGSTVVIWKKQEDGAWLMDLDIWNSALALGQ